MSEFRIRMANAEDIDEMARLDEICFDAPWSRKSFEAELTANNLARYLVAETAGGEEAALLVGYAGLWAIGTEGHITNVAVRPEFRRMCIGRMLVENLINWTKSQGLARYTLEVRKSNRPAIRLYEGFGFTDAGIRKGYYENNEDAIIMWLDTETAGEEAK